LNIRDGKRLSVADAYLPPQVMARPNLTLLAAHEVEHIVLDGYRARGVSAVCGETVTVSADRSFFAPVPCPRPTSSCGPASAIRIR
jgi:pyridoxine 4-oxidase